MTTAAIIVAAGRGLRAGGDIPKQWRCVAGRRVVDIAIDAFAAHPGVDEVVVVIHPDDIEKGLEPANPNLIVVEGAQTRAGSVRAGLQAVKQTCTHVLIHDAARPCVTDAVIDRVLGALQTGPAAAPAVGVVDALWRGTDATVCGTASRHGLFRAQTPQGFDFRVIQDAHSAFEGDAADDVEIVRNAGVPVTIVDGDEDNLKITLQDDFDRAERILKGRSSLEIRVGNGFDVHRFGPGNHVVLCGVRVPFERGLQGHSDADVGLHAITDAIYGALAQGDIGRHFPPSDPQWKGAASDIFLSHSVDLAANMGFRIGNIDCTLMCEFPKIGPYGDAMQARVADIIGVDSDRVSVKATTTERLGFTGRGEGIACMATVMLVPE